MLVLLLDLLYLLKTLRTSWEPHSIKIQGCRLNFTDCHLYSLAVHTRRPVFTFTSAVRIPRQPVLTFSSSVLSDFHSLPFILSCCPLAPGSTSLSLPSRVLSAHPGSPPLPSLHVCCPYAPAARLYNPVFCFHLGTAASLPFTAPIHTFAFFWHTSFTCTPSLHIIAFAGVHFSRPYLDIHHLGVYPAYLHSVLCHQSSLYITRGPPLS